MCHRYPTNTPIPEGHGFAGEQNHYSSGITSSLVVCAFAQARYVLTTGAYEYVTERCLVSHCHLLFSAVIFAQVSNPLSHMSPLHKVHKLHPLISSFVGTKIPNGFQLMLDTIIPMTAIQRRRKRALLRLGAVEKVFKKQMENIVCDETLSCDLGDGRDADGKTVLEKFHEARSTQQRAEIESESLGRV